MKNKELKKHTNQIIKDYNSNIRVTTIAQKYDVHDSLVRRILVENGIIIKKREPWSKYSFDINFFDEINTEEKAYVLGFLYADGCNFQKRSTVVLALKKDDEAILVKIKNTLKANCPIFTTKKGKFEQRGFCLTNKHFSQQLAKLGCMQAKTFKIKFPDESIIPKNLLNHFIRGYMDGDGCISFYTPKKGKRPRFALSFVGTEEFCNKLNEIFQKIIQFSPSIRARHPERKNNIRQFQIGGNPTAQKILDWIYSEASIYLDRKYKKYLSLKEVNAIPYRKRVLQIDPTLNKVVNIWDNAAIAARSIGSHYENIRVVCGGGLKYKRDGSPYIPKTHKGFIWQYE